MSMCKLDNRSVINDASCLWYVHVLGKRHVQARTSDRHTGPIINSKMSKELCDSYSKWRFQCICRYTCMYVLLFFPHSNRGDTLALDASCTSYIFSVGIWSVDPYPYYVFPKTPTVGPTLVSQLHRDTTHSSVTPHRCWHTNVHTLAYPSMAWS